ncbi:hypothetical protein RDABS01_024047 [Bienertia sinuspersici]
MSLENGLRKIIGDEEVLQMREIAVKYRAVEVYLLHSEVEPNLSPCEQPIQSIVSNPIQTEIGVKNPTQNTENIVENPPSKVNKRKKLTPKKGPHTKLVTPPRKRLRLQKDASTSSKEALITPALNINYTSSKYVSPTSTYTNSPSLQNLIDPPTLLNPLKPTFIEKEKQTAHPSKDPSEIDIPPDLSQKGAKLPSVKFVSTELAEIDTNFLDNYEWEDNRAENPLKWSELIGSAGETSEEDDLSYEPEYKNFCEGYEYDDDEEEDDDFEVDDETHTELEDDFSLSDIDLEVEPSQEVEQTDYIQPESNERDDELREARDRVKNCNNNILQVALHLHKEACQGKLGDQPPNNQAQSSAITTYQSGGTSDYEGSDEDIDRPTRSEEELEGEFKDAVSKYAVMQGRDIRYVISNKDKQRLGVKCVGECPFYQYCSIHSGDATWLVKKVVNSHTCHRNINKNRQLKSSWVARQLLEMFKSRPHWPAKEVVETIRRAYTVIMSRNFAYKVKYHAHKMLHGSMKEHYMKVERYIKALELASLETVLQLAILHAVATVLPNAEHSHYARHIFTLWHRTYKGDDMKLQFWKIAKAYNLADFNDAIDELSEMNAEAALAFRRLVNKRKEIEKWSSVLCPKIQARFEKEKEKAAMCDVLPSSESLFNVRYYLDQLNVDLVARSCSCRKWNMVGIPCCHAIACIYFQNKEV